MTNLAKTLERMYLPNYITILSADYDRKSVLFKIKPMDFSVSNHPVDYLTPRGTHLIISQGAYCFIEHLVKEGKIDLTLPELRELYFDLRLQITRFSVDMRRGISLDRILQGKLTLTKLRNGKLPFIMMDFDLGNKSFSGDIKGVITPTSMPPTNTIALKY